MDDNVKKADAQEEKLPPIDELSRYINRELSWLRFNRRVLDEACDPSNPLLERVKFCSIFSNNLDEFFMIRVSGLVRQLREGVLESRTPDGMTPIETLAAIRRALVPDLKRQLECWRDVLLPELAKNGIEILEYDNLKDKHKKYFDQYFKDVIFPTLTPLAFDPGHPFPHISNLSLSFAVALRGEDKQELFARVKIPETFPRLLQLPRDSDDKPDKMEKMGLSANRETARFVWLEDVIGGNLGLLFPGMKIADKALFRITRDAEFEIELDEAEDLLDSIRESVDRRRFGSVVRLQIEKDAPKRIREILTRNLGLDLYQVYGLKRPIGMSALMQLMKLDRPDLKDVPFTPSIQPDMREQDEIFDTIAHHDVLTYHPYDSFKPVVDFIVAASRDPDVLAIKQTLYRSGRNSPIVTALKEAATRGKQVAALVELKARFDEENNIGWARELESAGVHVVYGFVGLKTHAKLCLVVRREGSGIKRYVHMGTGNYNSITAGIYTDFGLFTADPEIGADVSDLFNVLTGYSMQKSYRRLLVAPHTLRSGINALIEREIEHQREHGNGRMILKLNSVSDKEMIDTLYDASRAGVKIDLQVRGICCLRPGVPGMSDNISVTSIVGRFLEHPRVYWFANNGSPELYLGSADLMTRNLDRRVETVFPVLDPALKHRIMDEIMPLHLSDNAQLSELDAWGRYTRRRPDPGAPVINSQKTLAGL